MSKYYVNNLRSWIVPTALGTFLSFLTLVLAGHSILAPEQISGGLCSTSLELVVWAACFSPVFAVALFVVDIHLLSRKTRSLPQGFRAMVSAFPSPYIWLMLMTLLSDWSLYFVTFYYFVGLFFAAYISRYFLGKKYVSLYLK